MTARGSTEVVASLRATTRALEALAAAGGRAELEALALAELAALEPKTLRRAASVLGHVAVVLERTREGLSTVLARLG